MFFTKYTLFAEKNNFIWKKEFILIFCFTGKAFLQKMKKVYILFEKYFLIQKIYIHNSVKKIFLIIKNIFVKYLLNLVNSVIWSLNFQKRPICGIP